MKKQDGATESDWDSLSCSQRLSWKVHNPIAYARYMRTMKKAQKNQNYHNANAEAAETRIQTKLERDKKAGEYLGSLRGRQEFASSMLTTENNELKVGDAAKADAVQYAAPGSSLWHKITETSDGVGVVGGTPLGYAGGALEAAKGPSNAIRGVGGAGGVLGLSTDGISAIDHTAEIISSLKKGDLHEAGEGLWGLTGDISSGGGNVSSMAKAFAKNGSAVSERAGNAAAGFGVASGGLKVGEGTYDIGKGSIQSIRAGRLKNSFEGTRSEIAKKSSDDLLLRDAAALGKMEETRRAVQGVGKVSGGLQGIAASGMELGGVSAVGGIVMRGTQNINHGVFKAADHLQRKRMRKKVVEQTTGLTNEEIRKFQKEEDIGSFSRAKQSLMRSQGYSSGKRAELFADQTEKRGEYLAKLASDPNNAKAKKLAGILGVKEKQVAYDAERLSKAMGLNESRTNIASNTNRIAAYKAANAAKPKKQQKQKKGTP